MKTRFASITFLFCAIAAPLSYAQTASPNNSSCDTYEFVDASQAALAKAKDAGQTLSASSLRTCIEALIPRINDVPDQIETSADKRLTEALQQAKKAALAANDQALASALEPAITKAALGLTDAVKQIAESPTTEKKLAATINAALTQAASSYTEVEAHKQLVDFYLTYKRLKRWAKQFGGAKVDTVDAGKMTASLDQLQDAIYKKLGSHGLYAPFSAELVTGATFLTAQNGSSAFISSSDSKNATVSAYVAWESRHFGDEDRSQIDASLAGRFGFIPALTLVQQQGSSTQSTAAKYQDAFAWSTTAKGNVKWYAAEAEIPFAATYGQFILTTDTSVIDQTNGSGGTTRTVLVPVDNGAGDAQSFWEFTTGLNVYGRSLHVVHAEKNFINPVFSAVIGYKHDTRFQADRALVKFDSPAERLVFRIFTAPMLVKTNSSAKPLAIAFGVEHEWAARGTNTIPSGTRIILRGDVDLLKALRPAPQ
ncbi:MAG: hypothetical protein HY047_14530 [Acidobacteria bacterium]|nr:hypothetical protein [Acidobacteriota bacterium]